MNLLEVYRLDSINGWSLPVTEGVIGIPDVVAILGLLVMTFLLRKRHEHVVLRPTFSVILMSRS